LLTEAELASFCDVDSPPMTVDGSALMLEVDPVLLIVLDSELLATIDSSRRRLIQGSLQTLDRHC